MTCEHGNTLTRLLLLPIGSPRDILLKKSSALSVRCVGQPLQALQISPKASEDSTSKKDKIRFYEQTRGSEIELHNHLLLSKDLGYITEPELRDFVDKITVVLKEINGLIQVTHRYHANT